MQIESVSPVLLVIPNEPHEEDKEIAISLSHVIDSPREGTPLRGDRFEHVIVAPDPQDNISHAWGRVIGKILKHIVIGILEGIGYLSVEAGYNKLTEETDEEETDELEETDETPES